MPRELNSLRVSTEDLRHHIVWNIGAAAVAVKLAARFDASLILQGYSLPVIDCKRPPGGADSIVKLGESTRIPGNESVSAVHALVRERAVFRPNPDRARTELDVRDAQHRHPIIIAMQSFGPWLHGRQRP